MSEAGWAILRQTLLAGYGDMVRRLTARLGSRDLAQDALHETYLRLEREGELAPVLKPKAFLMRMALNNASNQRRSGERLISASDGRELLELIDDAPGAERILLAQSDMARLRTALAELPERRREIFVSAWGEGLSRQEIADQFGIAVRTVKHELTLARRYCADRLGLDAPDALPLSSRELSTQQGEPCTQDDAEQRKAEEQ